MTTRSRFTSPLGSSWRQDLGEGLFECARVGSPVGSARGSDASDLACEVTLELVAVLAEDVWDRLLGVKNGERGEKG